MLRLLGQEGGVARPGPGASRGESTAPPPLAIGQTLETRSFMRRRLLKRARPHGRRRARETASSGGSPRPAIVSFERSWLTGAAGKATARHRSLGNERVGPAGVNGVTQTVCDEVCAAAAGDADVHAPDKNPAFGGYLNPAFGGYQAPGSRTSVSLPDRPIGSHAQRPRRFYDVALEDSAGTAPDLALHARLGWRDRQELRLPLVAR